MAKHSLDIEFSKYWAQLSAGQRQSVITFIQSFYTGGEVITTIDINELQEPGAEYNVPWQIFKPLSKQQKKALINFLESSGIEPAGRISIEQYNKEIDEAMEEVRRGEVYTHEEVVEMSKKW